MVLVASLGVTAHLYRRFGQTINNEERDWINAACAMAANFLALILLSTDIHDYFGQSTAMTDRQRLNNTQEFALSLLWTIYGALALIVGFTRRSRVVRLFALGLLAWTFLKVVFVDTSYASASWHSLVFNQTFGAFVFLIIALACAIRFYARGEGIDEIERKVALTGLTIAINLLGLIGLSAEGYGRLESRIRSGGVTADDMPDLLLARGLSLSIIWAVYGGAMLTVGIWRSNRLLRVMALGLLVITILKVFLLDLASLDKIYRIISFIVLGAILLAVSFLYQKERIRNKGKN